MILGFAASARQSQALAQHMNVSCKLIQVHRFPDGESKITVPTELPATVIFLLSLDHPNDKLVELILAIGAARAQGAERVLLVAPYLCYMRQDMEFEPGQAISQLIIGDLLSRHVDAIVTVDPHLHRINNLSESFTHCQAVSLSAAASIGDYLKSCGEELLLVGPDEESEQWVKVAAQASGLPWCVAHKERLGDRDVQVSLPAGEYQGKTAMLLDDVISSGHTIKQAAQALMAAGCSEVKAVCTHALFAEGAEQALQQAGVRSIVSCNSIPHPSNHIDLSPLLAAALVPLLNNPLSNQLSNQ